MWSEHNMLHNPTHTLFLLHQMNYFLQYVVQHPAEAERNRENIRHQNQSLALLPSVLPVSPRGPYLPLMLKFFPSIRCLREGCLENAGMTASKSASKPVNNTAHTSLEYKCSASNATVRWAFVKKHFQLDVQLHPCKNKSNEIMSMKTLRELTAWRQKDKILTD